MTALAQIRHVLAKDVRQLAPLLVLHLAVVVVAVVHRATDWPGQGELVSLAPWFVLLTGMLVAAAAVQADSPLRDDAFWRAHPLRPGSLAGEKLVLAIAIALVGITGQAIAIATFDVHGAALVDAVIVSALAHLGILLGTMVIAATVRDLRAVTLALVVGLLALFVLPALVAAFLHFQPIDAPAAVPRPSLRVVAVAIGGVALLVLYRWGSPSRGTHPLAWLAVVAMWILGGSTHPARSPALAQSVPLTISLDSVSDRPSYDPGTLVLRLSIDSLSPDRMVHLARPTIGVRLRDGSTYTLQPAAPPHVFDHLRAPVPRVAGVRWRASELQWTSRNAVTLSVTAQLSAADLAALRRGVAGYVLDADAIVGELRPTGTMPLRAGATHDRAGLRVRIAEWNVAAAQPELALRVGTVVRSPGPAMFDSWTSWQLSPALVNAARGEAIALERSSGSSGSGGLVLPIGFFDSGEEHYVLREPVPAAAQRVAAGDSLPRIDAAWLADARLLLTSMVPVGRVRVHLLRDAP